MQVLRKNVDGLHVGPVCELIADFPLQRREQQPFPGVVAGQPHLLGGGSAAPDESVPHGKLCLALRGDERYLQKFLPLAPVDGQDAVGRHFGHRLLIIVVHAVHAVFFLGGFGFDHALPKQHFADFLAKRRVVADLLGQDVPRARQSVVRGRHFLFGVDVLFRFGLHVPLGQLQQQPQGQGFQAPFLGDGGAGAALGPEGAVNILQLGQGLGLLQGQGQLVRQHALFLQGLYDFLPALFQIAQIFQAFR